MQGLVIHVPYKVRIPRNVHINVISALHLSLIQQNLQNIQRNTVGMGPLHVKIAILHLCIKVISEAIKLVVQRKVELQPELYPSQFNEISQPIKIISKAKRSLLNRLRNMFRHRPKPQLQRNPSEVKSLIHQPRHSRELKRKQ